MTKNTNLLKAKNLPLLPQPDLLLKRFSWWGSIRYENFRRFHRRKLKKIKSKHTQVANAFVWVVFFKKTGDSKELFYQRRYLDTVLFLIITFGWFQWIGRKKTRKLAFDVLQRARHIVSENWPYGAILNLLFFASVGVESNFSDCANNSVAFDQVKTRLSVSRAEAIHNVSE